MPREDYFLMLVCKEMNISKLHLRYGGKSRKYSEAKQLFTTLLAWHTTLNQDIIAELSGYSNRSVIPYNEKQVLNNLATNKDYQKRILPIISKAKKLADELEALEMQNEIFDFYSEAAFDVPFKVEAECVPAA